MKKLLIIIIPVVLLIGFIGFKVFFTAKSDSNVKFDDETTIISNETNAEQTTNSSSIKVTIETNVSEDYVEPTIENNGTQTPAGDISNETTKQSISYTIIEETTGEPTTQSIVETTKKTKKKKKKKNNQITTVTTTEKEITTTEKKTTSKKIEEPKATKKEPETKKLGSYSEKNAISSNKVSVIRNSIVSKFSGSTDSEKSSLAKYMSANRLSSANDTYKKLTNVSKNFSVKTFSATLESDSQDNILNIAQKATSSIGSLSGSYGIGISTTEQTVGYKIYIVVVY